MLLATQTSKDIFSYRKYWAARFGAAPYLPMSRAEMEALGWDSCDIIVVSGDAYVDHPSFGMAIIGRLLESQGFRVGIIAQPDWQSADAFKALGKPNLFFGITAGNMDSMVNRYTSDRRVRSDDAYTPGDIGGKRPDRAVIVYSQRAREAYSSVPIIIGGIEASLRRIAHFDYWSEKVRRSVLVDAKADLLVYGNAERAIVDIAHRLAGKEPIQNINDIRGTAFLRNATPDGWIEIDSTQIDEPGPLNPPIDPYAMTPTDIKAATTSSLPFKGRDGGEAGNSRSMLRADRAASRYDETRALQGGMGSATIDQRSRPIPLALGQGLASSYPVPTSPLKGEEKNVSVVRFIKQVKNEDRGRSVIRMPAYEQLINDPILYAHASRILHVESNPGNARALVQRHGDKDLWLNPPPIPLTTKEMDGVYEFPYKRLPHPSYGKAKIPAYEMIRFSIAIQRGCFGGCTFCSITEHEGRIIPSRSENSVIR